MQCSTSPLDLQASDVTLPIRVLHLPMAFDERGVKGAIQRYMKSVRPEAPYLPSNVDFVAANNGLKGEEASCAHSQQSLCRSETLLSHPEAGSAWLRQRAAYLSRRNALLRACSVWPIQAVILLGIARVQALLVHLLPASLQ